MREPLYGTSGWYLKMSDSQQAAQRKRQITRVTRALAHAWMKYPDLRLGQLVETIQSIAGPNYRDIFFMTDNEWEAAFNNVMKSGLLDQYQTAAGACA